MQLVPVHLASMKLILQKIKSAIFFWLKYKMVPSSMWSIFETTSSTFSFHVHAFSKSSCNLLFLTSRPLPYHALPENGALLLTPCSTPTSWISAGSHQVGPTHKVMPYFTEQKGYFLAPFMDEAMGLEELPPLRERGLDLDMAMTAS